MITTDDAHLVQWVFLVCVSQFLWVCKRSIICLSFYRILPMEQREPRIRPRIRPLSVSLGQTRTHPGTETKHTCFNLSEMVICIRVVSDPRRAARHNGSALGSSFSLGGWSWNSAKHCCTSGRRKRQAERRGYGFKESRQWNQDLRRNGNFLWDNMLCSCFLCPSLSEFF